MIRPLHIASSAFWGLLVCVVAGAQVHGGVTMARTASSRVVSSGTRTSSYYSPARLALARISPAGPTTSSLFSYTGFHRSHRNLGRGSSEGPAVFVPILYGGIPYVNYDDSAGDSSQPEQYQQQAQAGNNSTQQPPPQEAAYSADDSTDAAPTASDTPVRDVGNFVLVRKDGEVLFASAFYVAGPQLSYVTPEGIRHTIPVAQLDVDATEQVNEDRGTTVQIHN